MWKLALISCIAAPCALATAAPLKGAFAQSCEGYLVNDPEFGMHLAKDARGANFDGVTWCDATFEGALKSKVLAYCAAGRLCHVSGYVRGHGTFNWVQVNRAW